MEYGIFYVKTALIGKEENQRQETFRIVGEHFRFFCRFRGIMRVRLARTRSETCPASPQTSPTWRASAPTTPNMDIPVISSHHQVFFYIFWTQYVQKILLVSCFYSYSVLLVNKNYAYSSSLIDSSFPLVEFYKKYSAKSSAWPGVDLRFCPWLLLFNYCRWILHELFSLSSSQSVICLRYI